MKCYIISFDLANQNNYKPMLDALKTFGTWAVITRFTWAVVTDSSKEDVFNRLSDYLGEGDSFFIILSNKFASWQNTKCTSDWLKKHL